jgi:hypothetical protein
MEFAYNAFRALGIEHTPFEANFNIFPEEAPDLLLSTRPSIPVSQDARERLRLLQEVHVFGTFGATIAQRRDTSPFRTVEEHSRPL